MIAPYIKSNAVLLYAPADGDIVAHEQGAYEDKLNLFA